MPLQYLAIISSVRENRLADRMVSVLKQKFEEELAPKGHVLKVLDPADYDLPVMKKPLHFYGPDEQSEIPAKLLSLNELVKAADVYIIILAEYNRNAPPALYNTLDYLPIPSFAYKSSGIFSYSMGPAAGAYSAVSLRLLLAELGALPVSHSVHIPAAHTVVNADGSTENSHVLNSVSTLLHQTEWWGQVAKDGRAKGIPA